MNNRDFVHIVLEKLAGTTKEARWWDRLFDREQKDNTAESSASEISAKVRDKLKPSWKALQKNLASGKMGPVEEIMRNRFPDFQTFKSVISNKVLAKKKTLGPTSVTRLKPKKGKNVDDLAGYVRTSDNDKTKSTGVNISYVGDKDLAEADLSKDSKRTNNRVLKGSGIGSTLYSKALHEAKKRGSKTFTSDPRGTSSGNAQRMWESLGKKYPGALTKNHNEYGGNGPMYSIDLSKTDNPIPYTQRNRAKPVSRTQAIKQRMVTMGDKGMAPERVQKTGKRMVTSLLSKMKNKPQAQTVPNHFANTTLDKEKVSSLEQRIMKLAGSRLRQAARMGEISDKKIESLQDKGYLPSQDRALAGLRKGTDNLLKKNKRSK